MLTRCPSCGAENPAPQRVFLALHIGRENDDDTRFRDLENFLGIERKAGPGKNNGGDEKQSGRMAEHQSGLPVFDMPIGRPTATSMDLCGFKWLSPYFVCSVEASSYVSEFGVKELFEYLTSRLIFTVRMESGLYQ